MLPKSSKLSTWQLMLMSTGGMIGCGWLFSPYYGFQTAGVGVLLSWFIVAMLTLIIGIAFAEVTTIAPVVGGLSRFIGITHNRTVSFVFLALGWLTYVVYLPIEVQSAMQYLSFWYKDLVTQNESGGTTLSHIGLFISFGLMALLTWFNCFLLKNVARVNSIVSIWKILVPIGVAWILILFFGSWENVTASNVKHAFSFEAVLLAITGSGLAFAFTGFQNGLILANSSENPRKALPYSLFAPILVGFILYSSLSVIYITCLGDKQLSSSAAPLLGIVSLFGIHIIINVLFIDAVLAPLGTANVYTAATSRILLGLSKEFFPKSFLNRLNKFASPATCLWFNAVVGACFLLPFPTWQQLVDFLSSVVVFSYIAGPVAMIVLRQELPELERPFKVFCYRTVGYAGFACCSLLIYWSSIFNLICLSVLTVSLIIVHTVFVEKKPANLFCALKSNFFVVGYLLAILAVKYLHLHESVPFPIDNVIVILAACVACRIFVANKIGKKEIEANLNRTAQENS